MAFLLLITFLTPLLTAQNLPPVSAATDYARLHEGVNPPKLIHSYNPDYTPEALQAKIEGSVVLQAVIDIKGNVAYASVLSPLPAGLDAKAFSVVKHWRYSPGVMDGEIIPVLTTIDVLFRLPYKPADPVAEQRSLALQPLLRLTEPTPADVKRIKELATQSFVPAIALLGEWSVLGRGMPKNIPAGRQYLQQAADQNNAHALFLLGNLQRAAWLGDPAAQAELGDQFDRVGNPKEAEHYFRFCAATGHANCQFRLGKLLVSGPGLTPDTFTQGVTWLELAKQNGSKEAAPLWETSWAKLSSVQLEWVTQLKPHLELKNFHGFH